MQLSFRKNSFFQAQVVLGEFSQSSFLSRRFAESAKSQCGSVQPNIHTTAAKKTTTNKLVHATSNPNIATSQRKKHTKKCIFI